MKYYVHVANETSRQILEFLATRYPGKGKLACACMRDQPNDFRLRKGFRDFAGSFIPRDIHDG